MGSKREEEGSRFLESAHSVLPEVLKHIHSLHVGRLIFNNEDPGTAPKEPCPPRAALE